MDPLSNVKSISLKVMNLIQYTPTVHCRHELVLSGNGQEVASSVFVPIPPTQLGKFVRVIRGVNGPHFVAINSVRDIIVKEWGGDITVFDKN